jgi:ATP-dependent DNA helicase DinG
VQNVFDILGPEGPLARHLDRFSPRPSQQEMAEHIEHVLADGGVFIAESGTGTGKTFAYLVPALVSGKKVVISTGTKHLQDQIYRRDLPLVREALSIPVTAALLKGRANYLCLHRLEQGAADPGVDPDTAAYLERVRDWSRMTAEGDISEVSAIPEDAPIWSMVTSNSDNCLGSACPSFDDCHVRKARKAALEADIVVVNHHLFFADLVLKDEGFGRLLPGADAVIFDEAHQMQDIATLFFGQSVSRSQIENLCRDVIAEELREQSGVGGLRPATDGVIKAVADFRLVLKREPGRDDWERLQNKTVDDALQQVFDQLAELSELLSAAAGHGEGLNNCFRRSLEILDRMDSFKDGSGGDSVRWLETGRRGFILYTTPLDVSRPFLERAQLEERSWVFTSATLAIDGNFSHFQRQFGLEEAETMQWPSPFDFDSNTLLYLPPGLPQPNDDDFTAKVIDTAVPVLRASRGRAFMLFTSFRALNMAAQILPQKLDYPLLVQGSAPKQVLLQRFRESGNAVLLGTSSFWEGVDVKGEALSCVIIDKLPFAAPDDPVLRARGRALESQGRNAFMEYQLPQAVIALKQGAGRLIRDENDSGVLVLCDPRLLGKGYGKIFLSSLPPMPRTRAFEDVRQFFELQQTALQEAVNP